MLEWREDRPTAFGLDAYKLATAIRQAGLVAPSLLMDWRQPVSAHIEIARAFGASWLVSPSPAYQFKRDHSGQWTVNHEFGTQEVLEFARTLQANGNECHSEGLRFAYHNHDVDLRSRGALVPLHEIARATDPAVVEFEIDVGWAAWAGVDPVSLIYRYRDRVRLVHAKDLDPKRARLGDAMQFVPLGKGSLEVAEMLIYATSFGAEHVYAEVDDEAFGLDFAKVSIEYLKQREVVTQCGGPSPTAVPKITH